MNINLKPGDAIIPANDVAGTGIDDDCDASAQAMADQFDAMCAASGFARDLIRAAWNAHAHGVKIEDWPVEIARLASFWSLTEDREPTSLEITAGLFEPDDIVSAFVRPFGLIVDELDAAETGVMDEVEA